MAWVPLVSYDFEDGTQGWTFGTGCGRSTTVGLEGSASIYVTQTTDAAVYATGPAFPSALTGGFRVRYLHKPASATGRNGYFYLRESGTARFGVLFIDGNIVQPSSGDALTTYTAGKVYEVVFEGDVAADKVSSVSIRNVTDGGTATVYTNGGSGFGFAATASLTEIAIQAYSPSGSAISYFDGIEVSTGFAPETYDSTRTRLPVDMPLVTWKHPVTGQIHALDVTGQPSMTARRGIGYESATIPCELDDDERESILGATIHVHSSGWQGIVLKRPYAGEPLLARGWGWCMTTGRRLADYCVTDLGRWSERTHYGRAPEWSLTTSDNVLNIKIPRHIIGAQESNEWRIRQHSGVAPSSWVLRVYRGDLLIDISQHTVATTGEVHGFLYDFGANQSATKLDANYLHNCGAYGTVRVYSGVANTDYSNNEPITWTLEGTYTGASGTIAQSITRTHRYVMINFSLSGGWAMGAAAYARFTGVKAYRAAYEVNGFVYDFGAENVKTSSALRLSYVHNCGSYGVIRVFYGVRSTDYSNNEPITWTLEGTYTGASGTINDFIIHTHRYILINFELTPGWSMADEGYLRMSDVRVYGMSDKDNPLLPIATIQAWNTIEDIISQEVDDDFLPSDYARHIEREATLIEPLEFGKTDAATKIEEIQKYVPYDFGWYAETVGDHVPYPYWRPYSTAPDYLLKLSECTDYDLDESTLDELASAVNIKYKYPSGEDGTAEYFDTDESHPLVQFGIQRFEDVTVQGYTDTAKIAERFFAERGRRQAKGSVTTRRLLTAFGAPVNPYTVRPMEMVRVLELQGGHIDCLIQRVTWHGDSITLTLDNEPYRLDTMLAKLSKRE